MSLSWMQKLRNSVRYRLTHASKFPKGDLVSFFQLISAKGFSPSHIIDVGANRGKWSSKARSVFPECRFTLVEPQTEMAGPLEKFCSAAPGSRWIQAGAGAEAGRLPLTLFPDTVSSGFAYSEVTPRHRELRPSWTAPHLW